ncbi:MAG: ribosome silencing factor [Finegoldia sp.]|nr:ribosome silencing factor [Finegoldia sp.]
MTKIDEIIKAIDDKLGKDIVKINLNNAIVDYFIITSANAPNHAQSIADKVLEICDQEGYEVLGVEGYSEGKWILIDLNDIVVHIFTEEQRAFYDIERLWA